jgi:electron transport complex protein RnfC
VHLSQHAGELARLAVKRGDAVRIGDIIAEADGQHSVDIHAPVCGKVTAIVEFPHLNGTSSSAIEIENNGADDAAPALPLEKDWREAARGELVQKIRDCGVVDAASGLPAHVKLSPSNGTPVDTIVVSAVESEPGLVADLAIATAHTAEVLSGALIAKKILGAARAWIAVEETRPAICAKVKEALRDDAYRGVALVKVKNKYPQGHEKLLIKALTNREVSGGCEPGSTGCVVLGAATVLAVHSAVCKGVNSFQNVVAVSGPAVEKPAVLLVRHGTPLLHVFRYCKADLSSAKKIIAGGPMTGQTVVDLDAPVTKMVTGLQTSQTVFPGCKAHACIHCGHCVKACPMRLVPSAIALFAGKGLYNETRDWHVLDCIECGACAFVCPSKINLVHYMKLANFHVGMPATT